MLIESLYSLRLLRGIEASSSPVVFYYKKPINTCGYFSLFCSLLYVVLAFL